MIATPEAYQLLHDGSLALADAEEHGIRIDLDRLDKSVKIVNRRLADIDDDLQSDPVFKTWKKKYGTSLNLESPDQLADILFNELGHPCKERTSPTKRYPKGRPKVDRPALERIDLEFIRLLIDRTKMMDTRDTFLFGIKKESVDSYLHNFFNLHIPITYRSSSDLVNFQNFPTRDELMAELVRSVFVADDDESQLVEVDFKGIEVCVAACYNHDPVLIEYVKNPAKDMHRDMAIECFKLGPDDHTKDWWKQRGSKGYQVRHCAKNQFVFPEFYGDYWGDCAEALWESMLRYKFELHDGRMMRDHLKSRGISKLGNREDKTPASGTFLAHIKETERGFWYDRFKVYTEWKEQWWDDYRRTGEFKTLTGFVVRGDLRKNQVINTPIQGSAFHCLLWVFIRLAKWLKKSGMKSRLCGQIHDSIIASVKTSELDDYLHEVMELVKDLVDYWKWIIVPMTVEVEVSPVGGTWFEKQKVESF